MLVITYIRIVYPLVSYSIPKQEKEPLINAQIWQERQGLTAIKFGIKFERV